MPVGVCFQWVCSASACRSFPANPEHLGARHPDLRVPEGKPMARADANPGGPGGNTLHGYLHVTG